MTWIKICGITSLEDGLEAASLGVDALGFVFAPSPRKIDPETARRIIQNLPEGLLKVGVFVNEERREIERVAAYCGLDALQFHGQESRAYCRRFPYLVIKAIHIKDVESLRSMEEYDDFRILLDAYSPLRAGGSGHSFPWKIASRAREKRNFILSGGLTAGNVPGAIRKIRPFGVDVASGVEETPGKKDLSKMVQFVKEVRNADEAAG